MSSTSSVRKPSSKKPSGKSATGKSARVSKKQTAKKSAKPSLKATQLNKAQKTQKFPILKSDWRRLFKRAQDPIELYYWPTPNGWKISIMLEECQLPYKLKAVNIGKGEQFKPSFLKISPNGRMPAIIDPQGPGNRPISIFESGAILQYLGRKTGRFYAKKERERVQIDEWLFWQMGGLGPMAGQANHFRLYAPAIMKKKIPYAIDRYTNEVHRLFGVMNQRLKSNPYLAGKDYSIADMACWGWVLPWQRLGQDLDEFPYLRDWFNKVSERPAVQAGFYLGAELRKDLDAKSKEAEKARKILFGQRANSKS